ncbi:hypothetical protein IAU60_001720 [Kwoniella sp. DSM 27419]
MFVELAPLTQEQEARKEILVKQIFGLSEPPSVGQPAGAEREGCLAVPHPAESPTVADDSQVQVHLDPLHDTSLESIPIPEVATPAQRHHRHNGGPLTVRDVKSDPILIALAQAQGHKQALITPRKPDTPSTEYSFKATPASARKIATHEFKLTRTAALRLGIEWPTVKPVSGPSRGVTVPALSGPFNPPTTSTPGNIQAANKKTPMTRPSTTRPPSILVKHNKTSTLRATGALGHGLWPEPGRDISALREAERQRRESVVLANQSREREGQEERRRTLTAESAPLPSLGKPSIAPRGNKTSELRAAGETGDRLWPERSRVVNSAEAARRRGQVAMKAGEKARFDSTERRKRVAPTSSASLGLPSAVSGPSVIHHAASTDPLLTLPKMPKQIRPTVSRATSQGMPSTGPSRATTRSTSAGLRSLAAPSIQPRLNKSALLRQARACS